MEYGVKVARKAWFEKESVINTWDQDNVNELFESE